MKVESHCASMLGEWLRRDGWDVSCCTDQSTRDSVFYRNVQVGTIENNLGKQSALAILSNSPNEEVFLKNIYGAHLFRSYCEFNGVRANYSPRSLEEARERLFRMASEGKDFALDFLHLL